MDFPIYHSDEISKVIRSIGITSWEELVDYLRKIPYGRNANRINFIEVFTENKGTCSTKHGLLATVAQLNQINQVHLILCMYKMNHKNTPLIGDGLSQHKLKYLPEAHCFISHKGQNIDITTADSKLDYLKDDIIFKTIIQPEDLDTYKVNFHKNYLRAWIDRENIPFSLDEIWAIRESCIANISKNTLLE